jgi:hypothetical protein
VSKEDAAEAGFAKRATVLGIAIVGGLLQPSFLFRSDWCVMGRSQPATLKRTVDASRHERIGQRNAVFHKIP